MSKPILEIKNLSAGVEGKQILKGISLTISPGEVHAIMGPNGSGKSTLAAVLAGRAGYEVTGGEVIFDGKDLLDLNPEERAREGVFLAFQYPVEIPGVNSTYFLKAALNEVRKSKGQSELDAMEFLSLVKDKIKLLELNEDLLRRSVNEGFSGGEKKRNEIFQMAVLEPRLAILDETDSGLDIDALRIVAGGVNKLKRPDSAQMVITHYQRLLNFIIPDFVHVLYDGRIVKSGDKQLALELEAKGYDWITKAGNRGQFMNLDEAQRQKVAAWIADGAKLSEIQTRLMSEFNLKLTYMEVRFLVDDLKLTPKDPEPPKVAAPVAEAAKPADPKSAPPPAGPAGATGGVSVTVDQLARPGAIVSGKVAFSDGQQADWYLDQTGRLGVVPKAAGVQADRRRRAAISSGVAKRNGADGILIFLPPRNSVGMTNDEPTNIRTEFGASTFTAFGFRN
jgi:Fe-S cluster assembly ATP-binding protein